MLSKRSLTKQQKYSNDTQVATIRDFSGGWNILDDDLSLDKKYSTKMYNCSRNVDSTVTVRYGVELFANARNGLSDPTAYCVNLEYFRSVLIGVGSNGEIVRFQADGSVDRIWDAALAAAQPGSPAPWGPTTFASFAQFNGELIICNGEDKPLIVRNNFAVEYLRDEGTGSNLNTPICRYVTVNDRFLIMAGDPLFKNRIHISARNTSGTFFGDPAPNDATFIDVGSVLPGSSDIRGLATFRDRVVVAFVEGTIIGELGTYDTDGVHTPNFDDAVAQYGSVSHRSMVSYGDDMLLNDLVGIPSLKRTVFTGTLKPERVSDLIDPEISRQVATLSFGTLEDRCFAVYNQREGQFMFFIPNGDTLETTTETPAYVFIYRPSLNASGWARFDNWNFVCGTRSLQNNLFFGDAEGKIWLYGNEENPIYSDFVGDPAVNSGAGNPIEFDWELPWSDMKQRTKSKVSKYISFDTRGKGRFEASMYCDRKLVDSDLNDAPQLATEFVGGDTGGFGYGAQPYGGGRNSADEHLIAWPAKFKLMKLRFRGTTTDSELKFVSVSMHYQLGNIYR